MWGRARAVGCRVGVSSWHVFPEGGVSFFAPEHTVGLLGREREFSGGGVERDGGYAYGDLRG